MPPEDIAYLEASFAEVINYESTTPLEPIDIANYRSPEGDSCLHIAAIRGDLKCVRLLLELGLDINAQGDMGNTPLHYARSFGHTDVAEFLLSQGARTDIKNEFSKSDPEA